MSIVTTAMTRTGCGCGSTGGSGSCGCGVPSCSTCDDQGFLRPRFFAGQLLTEDDLQLLGSYMASKNRLHNRFFMGDGVVAGLEVLCHPCDGDKIRIRPGYALDCCGNDIVVPCEEIVDVLALARGLGGSVTSYGCADPCRKPETETTDREEPIGVRAEMDRKEPPPPLEPPQRYCLYLRYCETVTDPTVPYTTSDPCGVQACEGTRVREGYTFELTCREEHEPEPDIFTTFTACIGDLVSTNRAVGEVIFLQGIALTMDGPLQRAKASAPIHWGNQEVLELATAVAELSAWNTDTAPLDRLRLLRGAAKLQSVNTLYLRYNHSTTPGVPGTPPPPPDPNYVDMANALSAANTARVQLLSGLQSVSDLKGPEQAWIRGTAEIADQLVELGSANDTTPLTRFLVQGQTWTRAVQNAYVAALEELREVLLDHMAPGVATTDCRLRNDVLAVGLPPVRGGATDPTLAEVEQVTDGVDKLVAALLRYWMDCLCRALNPPIPACDDERVLLACLDLHECEVQSICMTERKWVMTGPNVRYWMPPLRMLGDLLEQACCTVRGSLMEQGSFEALLANFGFQVHRASISGGGNAVSAPKIKFSSAHALNSLGRTYKMNHTRNFAELPQVTLNMAELAGTRMRVIEPEAFRTIEPVELSEEGELDREKLEEFVDLRVKERVESRTTELVNARLATESDAVVSAAARRFFEAEADTLVRPVVREVAEASVAPAVEAAEAAYEARKPELEAAAREAAGSVVNERIGTAVAGEFDRVFAERAPVVISDALASEATRARLDAVVDERLTASTGSLSTNLAAVLERLETVEKKTSSIAGSLGGHTATTNRLRERVDRAATLDSVEILERNNTELLERLSTMDAEIKSLRARLEG